MIEYQKVDAATLWPHNCALCRSQAGPFADTILENDAGERSYVCESCVRRCARLFGYAKGKRMDELSAASGALQAREQEITQLTGRQAELDAQIVSYERELRLQESELSKRAQRITQLEGKLREYATSTLAVVGDAA